jgi:hypothetical protein
VNAPRYMKFLTIILVTLLILGTAKMISAQNQNMGVLRVAKVQYPRQVAPSSKFSMVIDVEYAFHVNGTIRASLFEGALKNLGSRLWESGPIGLIGGGDKVWVVNLTAPSDEREWALTIIAYYLDAGKWNYYDDAFSGLGYAEVALKIATLAELQVDLGTPNIPVTLDASTNLTSATGQVRMLLPVGKSYQIAIAPAVQFENSTRVVFAGWQGGTSATQRTVMLDGDSKIVGSYKKQYLLQVNSVAPGYSNSTWYDAGSKVTLVTKSRVPMSWPFGLLGLSGDFNGWSGAVNSGSTQINITMNGPKVVTANFTADYTPLVIPAIIVAGMFGALALFVARKRVSGRSVSVDEVVSEEETSKVCASCGKPVEDDWTHCIYCGKALNATEPV